jgi:hypothetical protein
MKAKKAKRVRKPRQHQFQLNKAGRTLLRQIVKFLNTDKTGDAGKLWHVLTALRGPDDESAELKAATTAVIRHAIGLKGTVTTYNGIQDGSNSTYTFILNRDTKKHTALRGVEMHGSHFKQHANYAFMALGLNWWKVNK